MSVTFKLRTPRGLCRRATFPSSPELFALSKIAADMIAADAAHQLLYRDSEGDWVLVASSDDVAEVVRDTKQANAATVTLHVRPHRKRQQSSTSARTVTEGRPRSGCGGASWHRGRGWVHHVHPAAGLVGAPWARAHPLLFPRRTLLVDLDDFVRDMEGLVGAFCGLSPPERCHRDSPAQEAASGAGEGEGDRAAAKATEPAVSSDTAGDSATIEEPSALRPERDASGTTATATCADSDADEEEGAPATTITGAAAPPTDDGDDGDDRTDGDRDDHDGDVGEEDAPSSMTSKSGDAGGHEPDVEEAPEDVDVAAGFVEVEAPQAAAQEPRTEGPSAPDSSSDDGIEAKVALLSDMGFDLPADVSRNMIREMGGRMDLIVRALVANKL